MVEDGQKASMEQMIGNLHPHDTENGFGFVVEISKGDDFKILGLMGKDSIFIPLNVHPNDIDDLKLTQIINTNFDTFAELNVHQTFWEVLKSLDLPLNTETLGIQTDHQAIGLVAGIHLHPNDPRTTQEKFITMIDEVFALKGLNLKYLEIL